MTGHGQGNLPHFLLILFCDWNGVYWVSVAPVRAGVFGAVFRGWFLGLFFSFLVNIFFERGGMWM